MVWLVNRVYCGPGGGSGLESGGRDGVGLCNFFASCSICGLFCSICTRCVEWRAFGQIGVGFRLAWEGGYGSGEWKTAWPSG